MFVANTGADAKVWEYWYGQSTANVAAKVSAFSGRIVKVDRLANGSYNFVQVRILAPTTRPGGTSTASRRWVQ